MRAAPVAGASGAALALLGAGSVALLVPMSCCVVGLMLTLAAPVPGAAAFRLVLAAVPAVAPAKPPTADMLVWAWAAVPMDKAVSSTAAPVLNDFIN